MQTEDVGAEEAKQRTREQREQREQREVRSMYRSQMTELECLWLECEVRLAGFILID